MRRSSGETEEEERQEQLKWLACTHGSTNDELMMKHITVGDWKSTLFESPPFIVDIICYMQVSSRCFLLWVLSSLLLSAFLTCVPDIHSLLLPDLIGTEYCLTWYLNLRHDGVVVVLMDSFFFIINSCVCLSFAFPLLYFLFVLV